MARCEDCLKFGIEILCENPAGGTNRRTVYKPEGVSQQSEGDIEHCQIRPLLEIIAGSLQASKSDCDRCIYKIIALDPED